MSLGTAPSKPSFFLLYWLKSLKGLIFKKQDTRVTGIWPLMRLFWLFSDTVTCTLLESWSFPSLYVIRIQGLFCMHAADKNKLRTINLVVLIEPFRRTSVLVIQTKLDKSFHDALVSQMTAAFFLSFLCLSIKSFILLLYLLQNQIWQDSWDRVASRQAFPFLRG